jgi:hypothetical protein
VPDAEGAPGAQPSNRNARRDDPCAGREDTRHSLPLESAYMQGHIRTMSRFCTSEEIN